MVKLEPQEVYDNFIVGKAKNKFGELVYAYSAESVIEHLQKESIRLNNISEEDAFEEAIENFEFNFKYAYFKGCPVYIYTN